MRPLEQGIENEPQIKPNIDKASQDGPRGPITIDLLGTGYSADIYNKALYRMEKTELAAKTEVLIARAKLWTPEIAHQIIERGLERSDSQYTSWIGFRYTTAPQGQYEGAAWQEEIHVPTRGGDRYLLFMKLRVFAPEAQGHHLGRTAMQLALGVHSDAELIAHRSGSARGALAWLESGVFKEGGRFPRDVSFDKVPAMPQILLWLWDTYHTKGEVPSLITGVSKGDYPEPNGADPVDEKYPKVMEIRAWMENVLKMKLTRGDALYEIGQLK